MVVAAGAFLAAHLRRYRGGKVALEVQYDLRNEMQAHLQQMDFAALDRMPTGQLVARASSDTTLVQGLLMFIPMMSGNVLLMVLSLGVMLVALAAAGPGQPDHRARPDARSATGCGRRSSPPPGTPSSAKAR